MHVRIRKLEQYNELDSEKWRRGIVYIDGTAISAHRAMLLRPGISDHSIRFTLSNGSHTASITTLAICLHIFGDNEILNN